SRSARRSLRTETAAASERRRGGSPGSCPRGLGSRYPSRRDRRAERLARSRQENPSERTRPRRAPPARDRRDQLARRRPWLFHLARRAALPCSRGAFTEHAACCTRRQSVTSGRRPENAAKAAANAHG